eukprot:jgi/Botrbrau1/20011/Bobra.200_1s0017.1
MFRLSKPVPASHMTCCNTFLPVPLPHPTCLPTTSYLSPYHILPVPLPHPTCLPTTSYLSPYHILPVSLPHPTCPPTTSTCPAITSYLSPYHYLPVPLPHPTCLPTTSFPSPYHILSIPLPHPTCLPTISYLPHCCPTKSLLFETLEGPRKPKVWPLPLAFTEQLARQGCPNATLPTFRPPWEIGRLHEPVSAPSAQVPRQGCQPRLTVSTHLVVYRSLP